MMTNHSRPRPILFACALLLTVVRGVDGQDSTSYRTQRRAAQHFIDALRAATHTPAISAAVASKGSIVFSSGTGVIDLEHQTPATGTSVYNIGSVSKIYTAIAVMQLLQQKRISLDDDIRTYVPEFPDKGARITLRHLLTQSSGIRHYHDTDFPGTPDNENILPIHDYLDGLKFFASDSLLFPPGAYYFYSSYGVNLLQGVVEKASGVPFERYLKEHVWTPAGIPTTSFDIPDRIVPNRARAYRIDHDTVFNYYYNDLRYKFASGGMIGSAEDLVKLASAMNHGRLLDSGTVALMITPQLSGLREFREGAEPRDMTFEQGVMWRLRRDAHGRRVAYHCGSIRGSNACLVDFLDEDLVAAIATNSWECCGWSKADSIANFFRLGSRPRK